MKLRIVRARIVSIINENRGRKVTDVRGLGSDLILFARVIGSKDPVPSWKELKRIKLLSLGLALRKCHPDK